MASFVPRARVHIGLVTTSLPFARRLSAREFALVTALVSLSGACDQISPPPIEPAPLAPVVEGTTFMYNGFKHRVTSSNGWKTTFVDDSGRVATRIGVFITDDPKNPVTIDSAKLASLWPLTAGNRAEVPLTVGTERWEWAFSVTGQQEVETPSGVYKTYVVEAVQTRLDSVPGQPRLAIAYAWNYAPSIAAVARFEGMVLSGPARGRRFGAVLRGILKPGETAPPDSTAATADSKAPTP